jgi:N-sulfoglucosamine sulfohydrolase
MTRFVSCLLGLLIGLPQLLNAQETRPNVLWIFVEDMNDWLGCYGDRIAKTPNIDKLAARGAMFRRAYMPAGVCSPTRSAVITSCWQTSIGAHNHRSSRGSDLIPLPNGVRPLPAILKEAGYYTFNFGKTDYNFSHDSNELYDSHKGSMNFDRIGSPAKLWRPAQAQKKPFFGQIQLRGGKNRAKQTVDPAIVEVPPYYPDVPLVRAEIAHHYDVIQKTDDEVGKILDQLKKDELLDNTIVFFFSDHGYRMHRHKQFLYEGSVRVPCIIAGPSITTATRDDLISGIDIGATTLALAGLTPPEWMQGRDVMHKDFLRQFVISARDRCDYTIDKIRAVTTNRYRYIRNFLTDRPYMQPQYRDSRPVTKLLRNMVKNGELSKTQMLFYGPDRPSEELYDLQTDPHEIVNLSASPAHRQELERHRKLLANWITSTNDLGQLPESEAGLRAAIERWQDKCQNPEYAPIHRKIAEENSNKHRLLIIGDSISMGYTPTVKRLMSKDTLVMRPNENCAGTTKGVANIDRWLQIRGGDFDLICFNFGLHDIKRVQKNGSNSNNPSDQRQAEPEQYEQQLSEIVSKLRSADAELVFVTTTPIPTGGVRPHRDIADPQRYNQIARRIMKANDIAILDLYAFALRHQATIQPRVDVHFTKEGSKMLGEELATRIRKMLNNKR